MKKIDALVKRVEFFERLAVYGNRQNFLKAIAQPAPFSDPNAPTSFEGDLPSAPKPDPAVKAMQAKLNKLLVNQGYFYPIFEDGKWGDQTNKALKAFRDNYKSSATPQAVAQATPHPAKENAGQTSPTQVATTPSSGGGLAGIGDTKSSGIGEHAGKEREVPLPKI